MTSIEVLVGSPTQEAWAGKLDQGNSYLVLTLDNRLRIHWCANLQTSANGGSLYHLPGFEELSMLLPRREGGVYPGGFLALVSSCPSCLFLFRITVPFPAKSWALYLVTPGYLHIPWMGFPFRFCFLHYIITHSGKVIAWSRDDRGAWEVKSETRAEHNLVFFISLDIHIGGSVPLASDCGHLSSSPLLVH